MTRPVTPRRVRVGRRSGPAARATLWWAPEGLELEVEGLTELTITRVAWDDVVQVSLHRRLPLARLAVHGAVVVATLGPGLGLALATESAVPLLVLGAVAAPFVVMLLTCLLAGEDVVSVRGRRSRVDARFLFAKARARALYEAMARRAREGGGRAEAVSVSVPGPPAPSSPPPG